MIKDENFIQISAWMINHLHLKGNELLIYGLIYGFSKDGNSVFRGSINYISSWLNISERSTIDNLKSLIEKKLITKKVIKGNGNNILGCEYSVNKVHINFDENKILDDKDYILVSGWMVNQLNLKGNELLTYALIYGFCQNTESRFKGSLKYIANWLNITEQGVIKVLKSLISQNKIGKTVESGPGAIKICKYYTIFDNSTTKLFAVSTKQNAVPTTKLFAEPIKQNAVPATKLFAVSTKQNAVPATKLFADNITSYNTRNSTTTDNTMTETKSEAEVLLVINNKINELFENQIEFSSDLASKLLVSFKKSKLDVQKICNYIQWAYKYLKERCKKQDCLPGYFYNSISETSLIFKFKTNIKEEEKQAEIKELQMIICPICGNKHNRHFPCEKCGNDYYQLQNKSEQEINKLKKLYLLEPEKRTQFDKEFEDVYAKYPNIFEVVRNPELKEQLDSEILEIEKKYGLLEEEVLC